MPALRPWFTAIIMIGFGFCLIYIVLSYYQVGLFRPLREPVPVRFPNGEIPAEGRPSFLNGDFTIVNKVRALPPAILRNYTEVNGNRLTMADPGRRFLAGDVIYDASIPGKRLIFAGTQNQKCFVHYEQGGRGLSFILAFFRFDGVKGMEPLWAGYCSRPAANLSDLRSMISNGGCR